MSHQNTAQKKNASDKVAEFISNNRTILWIFLGVFLAAIIIFAIIDTNIQKRNDSFSDRIVELQDDYQAWTAAEEDKKDELESSFLEKAGAYIDSEEGSILADKSHFLRGQLYLQKEEWNSAAEDFMSIVDSSPESYLASVSLYNGAAAYENSGDLAKALEILSRISENYRATSPMLPEVLFNIGRINEAMNNPDDAVAAYKDLTESYPSSNWTNLAKTRIISLKASGVSQ